MLWLVLLATMCVATAASAQTGKISGRVVDAANGDPLPGVNVAIEGTTQGTATDLNGEYVIIGVRPGSYTIAASFVGFTTQRQEGVRVNVDLTTEVDFALTEQVFEGQEVVVTAEAVTVRKDLTSSESRVTSESIENLPVQEIGDLLNAQAGITTSGGGIHIRGGRASEVAYFVDGVRVSDAYDGSISVQVETDGIEELQIISGTFNAEYGQAMSGIINIVTKEGGDRLHGSLEAYAGGYAPAQGSVGDAFLLGADPEAYTVDGIQYRDARPFGYMSFEPAQYYNVQGSLEGRLPLLPVNFYATGRYFHNDGFYYGARIHNPDGTRGDSSLVAMNPYDKLSGQVNLRYRLGRNMAFSLVGLGSYATGNDLGIGNDRYQRFRWNPGGVPQFYDSGYNVNLKFTHTLSARAFYTLNVANYYKHYERYLYEDPFDPRYNGYTIIPPDTVLTGGQRFNRGGTDLGRADRTSNTYVVKGDFTMQATKRHLVKTGFEARLDLLKNESYDLIGIVDESTGMFVGGPVIPDASTTLFNHFDEDPLTFSAYVQDKMEYEGFIVNAGLRLDYFDPRSRIPADLEDPNIYNPFKPLNRFNDLNGDGAIDAAEAVPANAKTIEDREAYWWQETDAKMQLSPRLGVAYPITETGVIHFSYGHFLQIPTFNRLFDNAQYKMSVSTGLFGPFGNPDLDAEKTIMYEIGLQQGLGPIVVDVTGFYRDVRSWVSTSVPFPTTSPDISYVIFTNRDYSNVRGVTLKASKPFSDHFAFDLNYTFQVAEGTNSDPAAEYNARQNNEDPTIALLALDWDQRHTASVSAYVVGGGWGLSTLARYGSGYPYTPAFGQAETRGQNVSTNFPQNSRRKPDSFDVDLYAFKEFGFGGVRPRLFVQVYNVFDAGNPGSVFGDTGLPDVTLEQKRIGGYDPGWFVRPDFYAEPRRLQVGVDLNF